jgi:hypothetical protein
LPAITPDVSHDSTRDREKLDHVADRLALRAILLNQLLQGFLPLGY